MYVSPPPGQCLGRIYVYEVSCHDSIKMSMPSQDGVRVMYIGMWGIDFTFVLTSFLLYFRTVLTLLYILILFLF